MPRKIMTGFAIAIGVVLGMWLLFIALAWNERRIRNEKEHKKHLEWWENQRNGGNASANEDVTSNSNGECLNARLGGLGRFMPDRGTYVREKDLEAGPNIPQDNKSRVPNRAADSRVGEDTGQRPLETKATPNESKKGSSNVQGNSSRAGDRAEGRDVPSRRPSRARDTTTKTNITVLGKIQDNSSQAERGRVEGPPHPKVVEPDTETQQTTGPRHHNGRPPRPMTGSRGYVENPPAAGTLSKTTSSSQQEHNKPSSQTQKHTQVHSQRYEDSQQPAKKTEEHIRRGLSSKHGSTIEEDENIAELKTPQHFPGTAPRGFNSPQLSPQQNIPHGKRSVNPRDQIRQREGMASSQAQMPLQTVDGEHARGQQGQHTPSTMSRIGDKAKFPNSSMKSPRIKIIPATPPKDSESLPHTQYINDVPRRLEVIKRKPVPDFFYVQQTRSPQVQHSPNYLNQRDDERLLEDFLGSAAPSQPSDLPLISGYYGPVRRVGHYVYNVFSQSLNSLFLVDTLNE